MYTFVYTHIDMYFLNVTKNLRELFSKTAASLGLDCSGDGAIGCRIIFFCKCVFGLF